MIPPIVRVWWRACEHICAELVIHHTTPSVFRRVRECDYAAAAAAVIETGAPHLTMTTTTASTMMVVQSATEVKHNRVSPLDRRHRRRRHPSSPPPPQLGLVGVLLVVAAIVPLHFAGISCQGEQLLRMVYSA